LKPVFVLARALAEAVVPDHSQTVPGFLKSVARPTMLNIAKNATRLAAPHIAAAVNGGGLPERKWADRVDATSSMAGSGSFRTLPTP
jgi:hypothetical protein